MTAPYPAQVHLVEVGPRDGLQNESAPISTDLRVTLCDRLSAAGFTQIEAGAFVSPKWVPRMADSAELMRRIQRRPGTIYSVLTPNLQGFEAALAAQADEVVIFGAASEAFSQRNINCSIAESIQRFEPVARAAKTHGLRLRASVSTALGCPYQGTVTPAAVAEGAARFRDLGCDMIDIADTIGVGTPAKTRMVFEAVLREVPAAQVAGHFHDTYGMAVANVCAALECDITTFHASVAGLGGCPYAKGATGNVATEDLLYLFQGLGIETGVDLDAVVEIGQWISAQLGRPSASRVGNALAARRAEARTATAA